MKAVYQRAVFPKLKIFENPEFGKIRVVEIEGEPWMVGKDVAAALGYTDTNKAIAMHVDDEDKLNDKTASSLGQRGGWLIDESGLYSLVLSSKLPGFHLPCSKREILYRAKVYFRKDV